MLRAVQQRPATPIGVSRAMHGRKFLDIGERGVLAGSAGTVEPEHVDHVGMVPADRRLIKFGARG